MKVADHEPAAEGQVEALEDPDSAHQDHDNADEATDDPHHNIETWPHLRIPFNFDTRRPCLTIFD
jgi:hypothetical protein